MVSSVFIVCDCSVDKKFGIFSLSSDETKALKRGSDSIRAWKEVHEGGRRKDRCVGSGSVKRWRKRRENVTGSSSHPFLNL